MLFGVVAATVLLVVAAPALADDGSSGGSAASTAASGDVAADGHTHSHGAAGAPGLMETSAGTIVTGALTGDSPCELSGPPASEGQVGADAEGHNHRGPLLQVPIGRADRELLQVQQAQARDVALQFPTVAAAEAAGYRKSTPYVPCIGAHYTKMSLVGRFDPAAPSELLFDGTNPDSRIVGLSYLVLHPGGPPEGFAGPNDVWHQHNSNGGLCINGSGVVVGNESTSPKECEERGGRKVPLDDIWMVHDWIVPGWECSWGVFAGECPELGGRVGGTVWDEPDPEAFAAATGSTD
jgi:hypothetical protein